MVQTSTFVNDIAPSDKGGAIYAIGTPLSADGMQCSFVDAVPVASQESLEICTSPQSEQFYNRILFTRIHFLQSNAKLLKWVPIFVCSAIASLSATPPSSISLASYNRRFPASTLSPPSSKSHASYSRFPASALSSFPSTCGWKCQPKPCPWSWPWSRLGSVCADCTVWVYLLPTTSSSQQ